MKTSASQPVQPGPNFGDIIYRRRKALGLTQENLADKVGVKPTYIGYLERGKRHASPRTVAALAHHLGLNRSYLFLACNPEVKDFLNISDDNFEVRGGVPLPQSLIDLEGDSALRSCHGIGPEEMAILQRCAFLGEAIDKRAWVYFWETIKQLFLKDSKHDGRSGPR